MPKKSKKTDGVVVKRKTRSSENNEPEAAPEATTKPTIKKKVFSAKSYAGFIAKMAKQQGVRMKGDLVPELDAATHFLVKTLIDTAKKAVDSRKNMQTVKPAAIQVALHALLPASDFKNDLLLAAKNGQSKVAEEEVVEEEVAVVA